MFRTGIIAVIMSGLFLSSCDKSKPDISRTPLLEVEGKYLYQDQIAEIIPPNLSDKDSAKIAKGYIKKWVTDVLMYENAKRNIVDKAEIESLIEDYRKSLTIHQYQQKLIRQRLPKTPSDEELNQFYKDYQSQFILKENMIRGLLLVVPVGSPKLDNVRAWVRSAKTKDLEQIEKYSIQHALSYDYFSDKWVSLTDVLKKMPVQLEDPAGFISSGKYFETSDSLRYFMLKIEQARRIGEVEPFESAKDKIISIMMNKKKADFIENFENELYNDAMNDGTVTLFK